MRKIVKSEIDYSDIDVEMVGLIKALNRIPYITTTECCIGHGKTPAMVFFEIAIDDMVKIKEFVCECLYAFTAWNFQFELSDPNTTDKVPLMLVSYTKDAKVNIEIVNNLEKNVIKYCNKNNW